MKDKDLTVEDCLKNAFQSLLNGDTQQRDVWCAMAEKGFNGKESVPKDTPVMREMKDVTPTKCN